MLSGAKAAVAGIEALQRGEIRVSALQDLHGEVPSSSGI
jgi:hypothetical protein